MVLVYFDHDRLQVTPEAAGVLREQIAAGGVSCGAAAVGVSPVASDQAAIIWKFDGCPVVKVDFDRTALESVPGARRVAASFVAAWHRQFATPPESCRRE